MQISPVLQYIFANSFKTLSSKITDLSYSPTTIDHWILNTQFHNPIIMFSATYNH